MTRLDRAADSAPDPYRTPHSNTVRRRFPRLTGLALLGLGMLLTGCSTHHLWLFHPKGPIAATELRMMAIDVAIMLGIIIPTGLMVVWFLWRYRASTGKGRFDPNWSHSTVIEIVVWGIPLIVVGVLGYYSYKGVYEVNPYDPTVLSRRSSNPLEVDVIATDWQWLFVYPKQHIAAVDELVVPAHTEIQFHLTSASVLNSFFIPELVGQIYVMPGMPTEQAMLASDPGIYHGFSAALSGPGFSWMQFQTRAIPRKEFIHWVAQMQHGPRRLTYAAFNELAKPTINVHHTPQYYSHVQPSLFDHVMQEVRMGKVFATPMAMTAHM
ncbi:MAG: COX aromatic rich motif-containing protein [Gammaproteobacteria bacterium]|nr:COX aromatic rich motif-containing protein [Gammaproteobacteria bacterium]